MSDEEEVQADQSRWDEVVDVGRGLLVLVSFMPLLSIAGGLHELAHVVVAKVLGYPTVVIYDGSKPWLPGRLRLISPDHFYVPIEKLPPEHWMLVAVAPLLFSLPLGYFAYTHRDIVVSNPLYLAFAIGLLVMLLPSMQDAVQFFYAGWHLIQGEPFVLDPLTDLMQPQWRVVNV